MSEGAVVLIVEDEVHASRLLQVGLRERGYLCLHARTGVAGTEAALRREPSIVLLDLSLPDIDGVEVTRRIRNRSRVPIVVVSARSQEQQKIEALDAGANDYVTKPFVPGELFARIRAALRWAGGTTEPGTKQTTAVGDLKVDFTLRKATIAGAEIHLTPIEFRLLAVMVQSAGQVLSHRQILRQVWGPEYDDDLNYLRVYMKKLRYKIEPEPAQPKYLINEPGVGYRLRVPG